MHTGVETFFRTEGLSLSDFVGEIHTVLMTTHPAAAAITAEDKIDLIIGLADLEHRLTGGVNERQQIGSLCALFFRSCRHHIAECR